MKNLSKKLNEFNSLCDDELSTQLQEILNSLLNANEKKYAQIISNLIDDYNTELAISRYSKRYINNMYKEKGEILISIIISDLNAKFTTRTPKITTINTIKRKRVFFVLFLIIALASLLLFINFLVTNNFIHQ